MYLNGDNHSSFPNNRVCVLWDMYQETLLSIALNYKGIQIWQLIHFKNLPFTCYICKVFGYMARECTWKVGEPSKNGTEVKPRIIEVDAANVEENGRPKDKAVSLEYEAKLKTKLPLHEGSIFHQGKLNCTNWSLMSREWMCRINLVHRLLKRGNLRW